MNVIEATFGTSLSPLFLQHGGLQRIDIVFIAGLNCSEAFRFRPLISFNT